MDPAIVELNTHLGEAKEAMKIAAEASAEVWDVAQTEANRSFEKLRERASEAASRLQKDLGIEPA